MIKYGRIIFEELPNETTETLITLCTDWPNGKKLQPAIAAPTGMISGPPGEKYIRYIACVHDVNNTCVYTCTYVQCSNRHWVVVVHVCVCLIIYRSFVML